MPQIRLDVELTELLQSVDDWHRFGFPLGGDDGEYLLDAKMP